MAGNSAGSVAVDLVLNTNGFNNQVKNNVKATEGAFTTSFKKIGAVVAAAFAVEKVVEFGKLLHVPEFNRNLKWVKCQLKKKVQQQIKTNRKGKG